MEPGTEVDTRKRFDLDPVGMMWEEFLMRHKRQAEDKKWLELFKAKLRKQSGGAESFWINGAEVMNCKTDGKFKEKQFAEENPHIVEEYTDWVTEKKFDVTRFAQENPELYEEYRASSFRLILGS